MTLRVLIVEDESLLVMVLEDLLPDLGYRVEATAHSIDTAIQAIDAHALDLAILDINLAGTPSFPVADLLVERGIPFLFASGYGETVLPPHHAHAPLVQKPFGKRELQAALKALPASEHASS